MPCVRDANHGITAENRTFEGDAMKRGVLVGMGFLFMFSLLGLLWKSAMHGLPHS